MKTKRMNIQAVMALLVVSVFVAGCPPVISWVQLALGAVQTIAPLVFPLAGVVASLAGKTIDATIAAKINGGLNQAGADAQELQALIASYKNSQDQTTLGKINAVELTIQNNLNSAFLDVNGISNPATQQKLIASVGELIADVKKIEDAIPVVMNGKPAARRMLSAQEQVAIKGDLQPAAIRARFAAAVSKPTNNPEVDAAFAKLATAPVKH